MNNLAFEEQWLYFKENFINLNKSKVNSLFNELENYAKSLIIDSYTISLTEDSSIHLTLRKDRYKIFIEVFIASECENEYYLNILSDPFRILSYNSILSYGGSFEEIKKQLSKFLNNE